MTPTMTLTTTERAGIAARLRAAGCVFAEDEVAVLEEAATSRTELERLVAERVDGRPLEQVVGWVDFDGLRIAIAPDVFVPRRRTELLARLAAQLLPDGGVLVELCCGSGAVAAAVVNRRPDAHVFAADFDDAAVRCAQVNLGTGRVVQGDLYDALPPSLLGAVNVLAANAPYVPSDEVALMPREARDHEPRLALDGGADGLEVQRRIALGAAQWLAPGGALVVETSRALASGSTAAFERGGLTCDLVRDDNLDATAVVGRVPEAGDPLPRVSA